MNSGIPAPTPSARRRGASLDVASLAELQEHLAATAAVDRVGAAAGGVWGCVPRHRGDVVSAVEAHVAGRELVVISVGATFGERMRALHGGAHRGRIRTVLVDEIDSAAVDAGVPVFVSQAARQRLNGRPLRLVAPPFPFFSLEFARKVAHLVLRLNIDAGRT